MKRIAWAASVGLLFSSIGCGSVDDHREAVGASSARIIDGTVDDGDSGAVGLAFSILNYFSGHCSGSLIAPNLVLTARHCVSLTSGGTPDGGVVCGQTNFGLTAGGGAFRATSLTVRPAADGPDFYKGIGTVTVPPDSTDICGNDIALIELEGAGIPANLAKPIVPRIDSRPDQGETYAAVGYGLTDPNNQYSSGTRMRADGKLVFCLGGLCSGLGSENVKESEWVGDTGTCPGDSGGPAIDEKGRVMGVLSRGPQPCGQSVYGDVSAWKTLITDTAKKVAQDGGYPVPFWAETGSSTPPPEPDGGSGGSGGSGGGGSEGAKCSSTLLCGAAFKCLDDGSGVTGTCMASCLDSSSCGAGKSCDPANKICLANPKTKAADSGDSGGCSFAGPVKPVPWLIGVALGALVAVRRRRRCCLCRCLCR